MSEPKKRKPDILYHGKIVSKNKKQALQDLINWIVDHPENIHVLITGTKDNPDQYTLYFRYKQKRRK